MTTSTTSLSSLRLDSRQLLRRSAILFLLLSRFKRLPLMMSKMPFLMSSNKSINRLMWSLSRSMWHPFNRYRQRSSFPPSNSLSIKCYSNILVGSSYLKGRLKIKFNLLRRNPPTRMKVVDTVQEQEGLIAMHTCRRSVGLTKRQRGRSTSLGRCT